MADEIAAQQKRVQARFPAGSRFLFPGWVANLNDSKAVSDSWCREQMETWLERIRLIDEHGGPARVTFHQFCHTLGTRLINANVPQHIVQQLLDHMLPQMTAIYARLHQKTLREHWEKSLKVNTEGEAVALDPETLARRIESDTVETGVQQWRLDHIPRYQSALTWMRREAEVIDTTHLSPTQVAKTITASIR
ncbi:tyrosine-type recombinase/integrase (plasmid) [Streptomyces sp. AM 4-1-1]|uniref:tyrosine-type recombinase/integrase n=1 Tax=Streptomyces sp. AM 4-1-1 TaxID=3028710 RepID=UPI0023B97A57|nr:tyrosine-type recombinase/integrase [Streptomyces sp. AM 4-1-1]WEH37851.1 tyrosine-type recombinase/integrase [Streptomyces sp. AM 4-1-1]